MALLFIPKAFTESGSKRRWLLMCIQVRNISKAAHAKTCNPLPPLFANKGCHRRRRCTSSMPENHRRNGKQMAGEHTAQSEMAEKYKGCLLYTSNQRKVIVLLYDTFLHFIGLRWLCFHKCFTQLHFYRFRQPSRLYSLFLQGMHKIQIFRMGSFISRQQNFANLHLCLLYTSRCV